MRHKWFLPLFNTSFPSIDATIAITFTDGIYLEILQSVPSIRLPNVLRWMDWNAYRKILYGIYFPRADIILQIRLDQRIAFVSR